MQFIFFRFYQKGRVSPPSQNKIMKQYHYGSTIVTVSKVQIPSMGFTCVTE